MRMNSNYVWVIESMHPVIARDYKPEVGSGPFATKREANDYIKLQISPTIEKMKFRVRKYVPEVK